MAEPLFSIIVPAYNAGATLAETLASLQAQTHADWEALVIDDGSTDQTAEIAAGVAAEDARLKVIRQANGGEAAARNAGLAVATGTFLVFLDSDDWVLPAFLSGMAGAIAADPQPDLIHGGWVRVAIDGHRSPGIFAPREQPLFPELAQRNCFAIHACAVRRSLVHAVGGFDATLKTCPDWDLWQRVARTGPRVAHLTEALACYRLRPFSAATDPGQFLKDGLEVIARTHRADARVAQADPRYAMGMPSAGASRARLEHLCWCAGLAIGQGQSAEPLLAGLADDRVPLEPELIAQHLLAAVPVPKGQLSSAWPLLWAGAHARIDPFLEALEAHLRVDGLAEATKSRLMRDILTWAMPEFLRHEASVIESVAAIERGHVPIFDWKRVAAEQARELDEQREWLHDLQGAGTWHDEQRQVWQRRAEEAETRLAESETERERWWRLSEELRAKLGPAADRSSASEARLVEVERRLGEADRRLREHRTWRGWIRLGLGRLR